MAIGRVELKDFLVFKGDFAADFCPGVNVIIGGNGTGKTTLMKVMHRACEFGDKVNLEEARSALSSGKAPRLPREANISIRNYFVGMIDSGVRAEDLNEEYASTVFVTGSGIEERVKILLGKSLLSHDWQIGVEYPAETPAFINWCSGSRPSIFIPTTEMLSHSRSFLALNRERAIPFDKIEVDILSKAELGETHEITPNAARVLDKLTGAIGGTVFHDGRDFYIVKESTSEKILFSFEAGGYRKLGLLWKLLRNGLLESGTVLFWDEPENSLNPELMPVLVDVLLELSRGGVQIFLATHSEMLARYFAVSRKKSDSVQFISMYKSGEQIKTETDDRFDLLTPNKLTSEPVRLYEQEIKRGVRGND